MYRGRAPAHEIFVRYIIRNILILLLPIALSTVYYAVSIRELREAIDTVTRSQLTRSMENVDRLYVDMTGMVSSFINDYEVSYYLSRRNPLTLIEHYNLKRISQKIAPYVYGNTILTHAFIYMENIDFLVFENGFGRYEAVYDALFSTDGYAAARWKAEVLRAPGREQLIPDRTIRMGGEEAIVHVYRRSIGYGENYLGAIVAILDRSALQRILSDVPAKYGGWLYVQDGNGNLLASTDDDPIVISPENSRNEVNRIELDGSVYRVYRVVSPRTSWTYTALLNETRVFAGARVVRNIAFALIGIAFAVGMVVSLAFAGQSAKPIAKMFNLILGAGGSPSPRKSMSIYEQVEQAVVVLSHSRQQLEDEVKATSMIARTFFFQNLLRGYYRSRESFERERELFGIEFRAKRYCVIITRIASLNAARDSQTLTRYREDLLDSIRSSKNEDDFVVPVSLDDVAVIRAISSEDMKSEVVRFITNIRGAVVRLSPGDHSFGVGMPATDPYLLMLSFNQAATAVSSSTTNTSGENIIQFYGEIPEPSYSYFYPIDVEESVMKAVRSGSEDLLRSLICSIRDANFDSRNLSMEQMSDLFTELEGTALRLLNHFPDDVSALRAGIAAWSEEPASRDKTIRFFELLEEISVVYGEKKRSHNSDLLSSVQDHIQRHFRNANLSLTAIADALGKSENYLSNFYKDQTGERLSVAIQKKRFEYAAKLLGGGAIPVDRIASECGYANSGSFRRAFKRYYGMSPSEYRESIAAGAIRAPGGVS